LQAMKLQPHEEVIVQGYTCVVVPNAIHAAGMETIYADIEKDTLNLDVEAVEKAITPKTRVVICQHTFGIPADTKKLREICDRHSLLLIEDCAHVLPDSKGPMEIGKLGDAMLLSFGRDKAMSGVSGGAIITRSKEIAATLRSMQKTASMPGLLHVFALLQYPLLYGIARPLYSAGIGKALLVAASKIKLLIPILTRSEKRGEMPTTLHTMPGACAALALQQLHKLEEINDHRRMLTSLYIKHAKEAGWPMLQSVVDQAALPLQKFPLFTIGAEKIRRDLKKQNIHLKDGWTGCVVCPDTVNEADAGYRDGDDPAAESACEQILSLPTHPTMTVKQAQRLMSLLDPLLATHHD
jgi:perosamine synthetase